MKRYFCRLSFLWILLATPLAASTDRIWVLNLEGNSIYVIDPITNKVVQKIEGIPRPHGVSFSPDGRRAYIANESDSVNDHFLGVADTKTGKIIEKVPLSGRANVPAITKDGKRVFVCMWNKETGDVEDALKYDKQGNRVSTGTGAVDIVDTTSLERVKTIPMPAGMHNCYTTPDGKYVVAGSPDGRLIAVIDVQTEQVAWETHFDRGVLTMAILAGPDGSTSRILVALDRLHGFAVVDFATRREVDRIMLSDKSRNTLLFWRTPTHGIAAAPDGKTVWVNSRGTNEVVAYSLPGLKELRRVPMPIPKAGAARPSRHGDASPAALAGDPHGLTVSSDGKTVYVAMSDLNLVSAIDVKTMKVVANIPVGKYPEHIVPLVLPSD